LNQVRSKSEACCHLDCLHPFGFPNEFTILGLAEESFEYHSEERRKDTCYMDRCPEMFPGREEYVRELFTKKQVFICEIEVERPRRR